MRLKQRFALFAVCTLGFGGTAMANLTFTGTLREPPPCTINSGASIAVDFDEMSVNSIDGINHRKGLSYTITCSASTLPWSMYLTVTATATSFDSSAVQSNVADLGIKVLRNSLPFVLNSKLSIAPASPPMLEVVPVKRPGSSLSEGNFTATAVLLAHYE